MNAQQFALRLVQAAAAQTGIDPVIIFGKRRQRAVCEARWACWIVMRKRGMTYMEIGGLFQRDHGTIIYGIESAKQHQGDREADFRELCRIVANEPTNQPAEMKFIEND